ncbi:MAG: T9SS type A sorting domain-containing protein [Ignavibacteria bacterium]|nr:T9SS type A sorting domain-containing protein [Ignavibacteria bacterium]
MILTAAGHYNCGVRTSVLTQLVYLCRDGSPDTTRIRFSIRYSGIYSLKVYNSTGQKLSDLFSRKFIPGSYQITFSSYELASGVYFYELSASDEKSIKKFVVLK